jgi:iron complex outermembrane receptor protein
MPTRLLSRALLAGVAAMALCGPAFAQDSTAPVATTPVPAEAAAEPAAADEGVIIVTAQNRAQNVQDVPIAISVVSGDTLKSEGVTDFTSVQRVSPSLQITSDTSNTRVSVRGVGTLSNNEAQDQSIAVNIDGEYINRPQILNAAIFDIERVEVLRGPQGTLYGRNSTGGAVNFITRKPGRDFGVNASATYGNYDQVIVEGGVDVPLGDVGAIRFAGSFSDHKGYNFHPNSPLPLTAYHPSSLHRSGDDHTVGGRVTLALRPAQGLTVDATYEHTEVDMHPAAQAFVDLTQAANAPGAGCAQNGWIEVGFGTPGTQCVPANTNFLANIDRHKYNMALTGVGFFKQHSDAVRGRIAYDFGPATLTYTGGYRESFNTGANTLSPAYVFTNFGAPVKTHSHELRLNGTTSGVEWQGGVFYFQEDLNTNGGLYIPFIGPNGSYVNYFRHPTHTKSWSAFGQAEIPLVDQLTAVLGGRYTRDKRSGAFVNYIFAFNSGPIELTNEPTFPVTNLIYKGDRFNWLAGLNFKPNRDTLLYAKVSTGYKAGGFDGTGTIFKPETNTAYEAGAKLNFGPEGRNVFNIAGFYYDYKDLQNDVLLNPALGGQTFNAGKATIKGVEAEAVFRLSENDTFSASVNYLDARYKDFTASYNVFDIADPARTALDVAAHPEDLADLGGNSLPQAPKWVVGVGYDHVFDLGSAGSVTARAYSRYKSSYYLDIFNYHDAHQKSYTQTDLSLEYKPDNGHFTVQAFVRNLENKRPVVFSGYIAAANDDIINWQFGPPRTYGVRLAVDF